MAETKKNTKNVLKNRIFQIQYTGLLLLQWYHFHWFSLIVPLSCLSVYLSILYVFICLSVCLFVCQSVYCPYVGRYVFMHVWFFRILIHPWFCNYVHTSLQPFIHPFKELWCCIFLLKKMPLVCTKNMTFLFF